MNQPAQGSRRRFEFASILALLLVTAAQMNCRLGLAAEAGAADTSRTLDPAVFSSGPAVEPSTDPRDFEGTWKNVALSPIPPFWLGPDLPFTPASRNIVSHRLEMQKIGRPVASAHLTCRPAGVAVMHNPMRAVVILQTAEKLLIISEEDRNIRQVHLGESHPKQIVPTYNGHSVAHWEGNTLVIDTVGYNGYGWLDEWGSPHSSGLHVVERMTKSSDGRSLDLEISIDDPALYTAPIVVKRRWGWNSGARMVEYDCSENPGDTAGAIVYENEMFRPVCAPDEKEDATGYVCKQPTRRALR